MAPKVVPVKERLLRYVHVPDDEDACWQWLGFIKPEGYGQFWRGTSNTYAHRVSYEEFVGEIPEGLVIDHLCRNRSCINPRHLEPVTPGENNLRGIGYAAKNSRKTHCNSGHPLSGANLTFDVRGRRSYRACAKIHWKKYAEKRKKARATKPRSKPCPM